MLFPLLLAAAAPAAPLAASSPWNVHAADSYCMMSRSYGKDAERVEVAFQPSIGSSTLTLMIATPLRGSDMATGDAQLIRQPGAGEFTGRYYSVRLTGKPHRLTQIWTSKDAFDALDRTDTLRIKAQPIDVTIAVGRSDKAKAEFRKCEDGLLESWGIAPATVRDGTKPMLKGDPSRLFRPQDYPAEARNSRFIGHVRAALIVGVDGVVKDCKVATKIGPAFDEITCKRARLIPFAPGLDQNGKPAQSLYQLNVRWALLG